MKKSKTTRDLILDCSTVQVRRIFKKRVRVYPDVIEILRKISTLKDLRQL